MVTTISKRNSRQNDGSIVKRLAPREPIVVVPVVLDPVEVQVPAIAIPVEVGDVEVAVGIAHKYAIHHPKHRLLNTLEVV